MCNSDADHVGASFDCCAAKRSSRCDVQALERVGAPDLAPVLLGTVQERQHVVAAGLHHGDGTGELLAQHLRHPLPVGPPLIGRLDHEPGLHGNRDREMGMVQRPAQEGLHLIIEPQADARG